MRKFLMLAAMSLLGVSVGRAVPIVCPMDTTLAALMALNPNGGCSSQDKIFSNFAYVGTDSPNLIHAALIFRPEPGDGDESVHGWSFTNANVFGEWATSFSLGFTISVAPGFPNRVIHKSQDQIDAGTAGPGNATSVADTQSAGVLSVVNALTSASETARLSYAPVTSVTSSSMATVPNGNGLIRYDQSFFETFDFTFDSAVPEPATYLLIGAGLLLFAAVWRSIVPGH